jgi:cell division protein ZapA
MKQLEVQIMGQSYLLGCPDGGDARLLEAVERVDTAMCKIREAGKVRARDRIAVLAALNLAFDLSDQHVSKPSSATAANSNSAATPANTTDASARLGKLLARLDDALGGDDRLI